MTRILVTGVGALIGYGIISSIRQSRHPADIHGMDIYEDAVGQHFCDDFIRSIPAADPEYAAFLTDTIRDRNIDLVFFGTEQEVLKVARSSEARSEVSGKLVLNDPALIEIAHDKWTMHRHLETASVPTIKTFIHGDFDEVAEAVGLPMLLKPRTSYASKGIVRIENRMDYQYWADKLGDEFMVQEIVGSPEREYTVSVFGFGDGTCTEGIIFRRKLSGEGATSKAVIEVNPSLMQEVHRLVGLFHPVGPTNFQYRWHQGQYLLLEINPRISSSTSIRAAFGFNEAEMAIDFYLAKTRPQPVPAKSGAAVRFIRDLVFP